MSLVNGLVEVNFSFISITNFCRRTYNEQWIYVNVHYQWYHVLSSSRIVRYGKLLLIMAPNFFQQL